MRQCEEADSPDGSEWLIDKAKGSLEGTQFTFQIYFGNVFNNVLVELSKN